MGCMNLYENKGILVYVLFWKEFFFERKCLNRDYFCMIFFDV